MLEVPYLMQLVYALVPEGEYACTMYFGLTYCSYLPKSLWNTPLSGYEMIAIAFLV